MSASGGLRSSSDLGTLPIAPVRPVRAALARISGLRGTSVSAAPTPGVELDRAIVEVVVCARPTVGRTRAVEIHPRRTLPGAR
jgi:hypothetical protein